MNAKPRNLVLTLMMALVLLNFIQAKLEPAYPEDTSGKIDIFTQKEPFSGRGLNVTSDAFAPEEEVIIYALVTYNDWPISSVSVAFEVHGPNNSIQNITLFDYAQTNETGIAKISFRIGLINEINFGEWAACGSVYLAGRVLTDFLTFKVGWNVEILSVKTINEKYVEQTNFPRGVLVGVELALRNIAMTTKKATIAITIYDSLNVLINSTEIRDFVVYSNETVTYAHSFIFIPENAFIGQATVYACAYTAPVSQGGVPYCPKASTHFLIVNRDIAILGIYPHPISVYEGDDVKIDVNVKNKGQGVESFHVNIYYNGTFINSLYVRGLQPNLNITISFVWDTGGVEEGFYEISAYAEPVENEIDTSDNNFTNGIVQVKAPVHDIAILSVQPSTQTAYIGETITIQVIVKNEGNYNESFQVTTYYNTTAIETQTISNLTPNTTTILTFNWNTENVSEGNYILSAFATPVQDEKDTEDNYLTNGTIKISSPPKRWFIPEWFYWLLLLLLLLIILLIIWLYHRKKKREKTKETFYAGWTAWYYSYNLKNKIHPNKKP